MDNAMQSMDGMYYEDDYGAGYQDIPTHAQYQQEDDDIEPDAWQESCWTIINAFFDEKGLVRQQLDSFDEFITVSVQQIVSDTVPIELVSELSHDNLEDEEPKRYDIRFDQIYLSTPTHWEKDGTTGREKALL